MESAEGLSFDDHDDIYLFGNSRGTLVDSYIRELQNQDQMRYNFDSVKMFMKKNKKKKNRQDQIVESQDDREPFEIVENDFDEGLKKVVFDPKIELETVE